MEKRREREKRRQRREVLRVIVFCLIWRARNSFLFLSLADRDITDMIESFESLWTIINCHWIERCQRTIDTCQHHKLVRILQWKMRKNKRKTTYVDPFFFFALISRSQPGIICISIGHRVVSLLGMLSKTKTKSINKSLNEYSKSIRRIQIALNEKQIWNYEHQMISLDQQEHKVKPLIDQNTRGQVFHNEDRSTRMDTQLFAILITRYLHSK